MTKQELIALIADYPDDAEVMAYDPITDTYEPIIEASDAKFYNGSCSQGAQQRCSSRSCS